MARRAIAIPAAAFLAAAFLSPDGSALDCATAETRAHRAICSDPVLLAADEAMTAALEAVLKAAPAEAGANIRANQASWTIRRDGRCEGAESMPACLLAAMTGRTAYLAATPANGPGIVPPLVPEMRITPASGDHCGTDVSVYRFDPSVASPAAALLGARIEEIFAAFQSNLGPNMPEQSCSYIAEAQLAFASPETVNVAIQWTGFPVGSYSDTGWTSIFADLRSGRLLAFADVFPEGALAPLAAACTASLREEKIARLVRSAGGMANADLPAIRDEVDAELGGRTDTIASHVGDLAYWRVTSEGATIDFGFAIGMYMDGTFECRLPKDLLQQVAGKSGWLMP